MPTYQYECRSCGHQIEEFQSIKADPLKLCPSCGKEELQRKVGGGAATLRFTGSGFYITDYARKGSDASSCCPCGKEKGGCKDKES